MLHILGRRQFLSILGSTTAGPQVIRGAGRFLAGSLLPASMSNEKSMEKAYGSGYFGEWVEDQFGLPAFHYTCDQISDPKAITAVNPGILSRTDHVHQVGNDRLVAVVSNYGCVQVRQDEGAPKFLNGYSPERAQFGGGIGYLTNGKVVLTTFYPGRGKSFDRIFGMGYLRKKIVGEDYAIDQVIFAPFGDDPVLISQVTIANHGMSPADLRWVEYWGCHVYEFSFRSYMLAPSLKTSAAELRRKFGDRFRHHFRRLERNAGVLETKEFLGRPQEEESAWQKLLVTLAANPTAFSGGAVQEPADREVSFDDFSPLPTFLASLDAPADGVATSGEWFFGSRGVSNPSGLEHRLNGSLDTTGPESALLLERMLSLQPGESRTLYFLYGYLPGGAQSSSLIDKYRSHVDTAWRTSSALWKKNGLRFSTETEPWVEREAAWDYYYVRSNLTYDSYFREHIICQGAQYQYVMGNQSSARDPLQHALPFVFSDPQIVKGILRYTLKEVRRDGSIPYGMVGHGMPMPTVMDNASDLPLWLLWTTSEYVLANRDLAFLDEQVSTYPLYGPATKNESVRSLLARCYQFLTEKVKTGEHGVMRMLQDDWNDAILVLWVPSNLSHECVETGESVLNSAMAAYVFDHYARLLTYAGDRSNLVADARQKAETNRQAVRGQWTGKWFRRAWLGPTLGWLGENGLWLEPQPWSIIGGVATSDETRKLVETMDELLRRPSPIGAMQQAGSSPQLAEGERRPPGMSVNGGVWPSLNATLIWALALVNGEMAWDEWKKNSLARHAEVYPDVWYSTWSGPDSVNSVMNKRPGEASFSSSFNQADFPVMNMHSHACELFATAKLLGLEFTEGGVELAPKLPLESYRFDSPLLGVVKTTGGYEGWYAPPAATGVWIIRLTLPSEEVAGLTKAKINGAWRPLSCAADGAIVLEGESSPGKPLHWSVFRA